MVEPITRVRMELRHIKPKIWRRVDVPLSSTLMSLHYIIQAGMGWTNSHPFEFTIQGHSYRDTEGGFVDWELSDAEHIHLETIVNRGIKRFSYTYDFGDDWQHIISLGKTRIGDADIDYPVFADGARRCPPEDMGGLAGFARLIEAVQDPTHRDHNDTTDWAGSHYLRDFDPDDINEDDIKSELAWIAADRR